MTDKTVMIDDLEDVDTLPDTLVAPVEAVDHTHEGSVDTSYFERSLKEGKEHIGTLDMFKAMETIERRKPVSAHDDSIDALSYLGGIKKVDTIKFKEEVTRRHLLGKEVGNTVARIKRNLLYKVVSVLVEKGYIDTDYEIRLNYHRFMRDYSAISDAFYIFCDVYKR